MNSFTIVYGCEKGEVITATGVAVTNVGAWITYVLNYEYGCIHAIIKEV